MSVLDLARPELRELQPYVSARMEARGGAIHLDANESPWPPFADGRAWNRYPDPQPPELIERLAGLYGVGASRVLAGRGSDEGIDLLARAFCRAGRDAILTTPPTFGMYAACARVQGAAVVEAPLRDDFSLDVDAVLVAATPAVKLVFVCAPNNPAGAAVARADILRLAEALAGRALLVVDEAYVEFAAPDSAGGSVAAFAGRIENLVVLRTLSKAWGLAGVRVGALLAGADVIALLRRMMPPYPLPTPCVEHALAALSDDGARVQRAHVAQVRRERARLRARMARLACVRAVLPSDANFLTVRFRDAGVALAALYRAGVVVRDVRHSPMLADALRISVGLPGENRAVVEALRTCVTRGAATPATAGTEQPA